MSAESGVRGMSKGRLEAFSDAVIAIALTIMVLELRVPHGAEWASLKPVLPSFLTYILSFVFLAIYWNNHHHMLHATQRVNGAILWANMHLLFWLSLVPFVTGWMAENHYASVPTATYGIVLLGAAIAYTILQYRIVAHHGPDSVLEQALGSDVKAKVSLAAYVAAIPMSFLQRWVALALYVLVAVLWLVPDRRIERRLGVRDD